MTVNPKELTVADWLRVRARVAEQLKDVGSQQRVDTRERVAEGLLEHGFIDVDTVRQTIAKEDEERAARRLQQASTTTDPRRSPKETPTA